MALTIFFSEYDNGTLNQPGTGSSLRAWDPTVTTWNALTDQAEVILPLNGEGTVDGIVGLFVVKGTAPGGLDRLYFTGAGRGNPTNPNTYNNNSQLWTSDGTEAGTRSLTPFYSFSYPRPIIAGTIDGNVFFSAEDFTGQASGIELYIAVDGTLADTDPFNDAGLYHNINVQNSGWDSSYPENFLQAGPGQIYFTADDGIHGRELWWSNGGDDAARVSGGLSAPSQMVYDQEGGSLFAVSNDSLYEINGTTAFDRTQDVANAYSWSSINLVGDSGNNGVIFTGTYADFNVFSGPNIPSGSGLWRYTDGFGADLIEENLNVSSNSIKTQGLSGNLFFLGDDTDTVAGTDLWRSNGSAVGTASLGTGLDFGGGLVGGTIDDTLFFVARDDTSSPWQLYRTTGVGHIDISSFEGADTPSDFQGFTQIGSHLYFFVQQSFGWNLYRIAEDGTGLLQIARGVDPEAGVVGADVPPVFNEILGTLQSDATPGLTGTDDRDDIQGLAGDDVLEGKANRDRIDGGAGSGDFASYVLSDAGVIVSLDTSRAEFGHAEGDRLFNIENLRGSAFVDDLEGNNDANRLEGLGQNDYLAGLGGGDILDGGTGNDVMFGGTGDDTFYVDGMLDEAREFVGEGTADTVLTSANYTLLSSSEIEFLTAQDLTSTLAISLIGNEFGNTVTGNDGANFISGGFGDTAADVLRGRGGADYYFVNSANDLVDESVGGSGVDTVEARFAFDLSNTTQAKGDVENLRLMGTADINGTGNGLGNDLQGNNGINTLRGLAGNDVLRGLSGNDTLEGGDDNDTLQGGAGFDTLNGGVGNDAFTGSVDDLAGDTITDLSIGDWIVVNGANLSAINSQAVTGIVTLASGKTLTLASAPSGKFWSAAYDAATGTTLSLNAAPNISVGQTLSVAENSAPSTVVGTVQASDPDASDSIMGFNITGGTGQGLFEISASGHVTVKSGAILNYEGTNSYSLTLTATDGKNASVEQTVTINVSDVNEAPTAVSLVNPVTTTAENGTAVKVADLAVTDDALGSETLALVGPDAGSFEIRNGFELWFSGEADFETKASYAVQVSATDEVAQSASSLTYTLAISDVGETTNPIVTGTTGDDTLTGGGGTDRLAGGLGADTLTGGTGPGSMDIFVFDTKQKKNVDTITDFERTYDQIFLDDAFFKGLGKGTPEGTHLKKGMFAANADGEATADGTAQIVYETDTGKLYYDADGEGGRKAVQFAVLQDAPKLTFKDFEII